MNRSPNTITSEALHAAADELDEQREKIHAVEKLLRQCLDKLVEVHTAQGRTHQLLVDEANRIGTDITNLKNRVTAVERLLPGVQPAE